MKQEERPQILNVNLEEEKSLDTVKKYSIEDFKAFSYFFNGKRDTVIKLFDDNKKISFDDIKELFHKIEDKLNTHLLVTNQMGITVSLSDGNIRDYSNFQVFIDDNWRISEKTKSLVIEWEFTLNHPKFTFPQKHTVKLRFGSSLRPDEVFKLMMSGSEDHEIEEATSQIVLRIDFINAAISNDIKNCIKDWYKALAKNQTQGWLINFFRKKKGILKTGISVLTAGSIIAVICFFATNYLGKATTNLEMNRVLIISFGVMLFSIGVFSSLGRFYAEWISNKTIDKFKGTPYLIMTKGDENLISERTQKNNTLLRQLFLKLCVALIFLFFTWLVGIFSEIIINLIEK